MNITSRGCLRSLGVALALASPISLCQAAKSGYFFSHVAGSVGGPGSLDGTGAAAEFYVPYSVAVARDGNVFVADSINNVIRKVTPSGVVTTFAGITNKPGSTDGTLTAAQFSYPCGVAFDTAGNLYVADTGNHLIRKIAVNGTVSTVAGAAGILGNANGIGSAARFNEPTGICVDATGVIYVADRYNDLVRKIDTAGVVTAFKGFYEPTGVAVDRSGTVYVANKAARNILQISAAGVVSTFAGSGQFLNIDGPADSAGFSRPAGVAVDAAGNVYVADSFNFTIRKISPDRIVSTVAGTPRQYGSSNGAVGVARFFEPTGVAVNDSGTLYVADRGNSTIRVVDPSGTTGTLAGAAVEAGSADGIADQARFDQPAGITVDAAGNLYIADRSNRTIRKISPSFAVTTIAGAAGQGGDADGAGTTARFMDVYGVAADPFGNVCIVDADNTIRKLSATGVVSTFAGAAGQFGAADGPATAARFSGPRGIATDGLGNVYVADTQNNSIRKITPSGMVTTLAGAADVGSGATDGNGASARFYSPSGLAVDRSGNV